MNETAHYIHSESPEKGGSPDFLLLSSYYFLSIHLQI